MSSVAAKPSSVKGMFKRLTTRLKRKGDKHNTVEEEEERDDRHDGDEVEVPVSSVSEHSKDKHDVIGTEDIEEEGKGKATTTTTKKKKKKNKVQHLLRRSKKYELTRSASRGHMADEGEGNGDEDVDSNTKAEPEAKGKEEDSDANIQAVDEQQHQQQHKEKKKKKKKDASKKMAKEEKRKEKQERKEKRKSRRKSTQQAAEYQPVDPSPAVAQPPTKEIGGEMEASAPAEQVSATGRPSNAGLIYPVSCPPQKFNGERSNYGLRAIEDAIKDVGVSIAPELQSNIPQMSLAAFVAGEEVQHGQVAQLQKRNLPSFELPPPPDPPRNARLPSDTSNNAAVDPSGHRPSSRRVRSLAGLSPDELAALAANRAPFQSPLPPSSSSPFVVPSAQLPQFTAQALTTSETSERVRVTRSHQSAKRRAQRRTLGPVPTFTLFASSPEPVKVPLLPLVLPGVQAAACQKRKGAEHDVERLLSDDASATAAAPEAKHPRLDEDHLPPPHQHQHHPHQDQHRPQHEESLEKADTEAEFEAIPEVNGHEVEEGRRIYIEEQKTKRRPSIHPDEIKILQEEQQRLTSVEDTALHPHGQSGGEVVTIYIADGSPLSTPEHSPAVDHPNHVVDEKSGLPEVQRPEEQSGAEQEEQAVVSKDDDDEEEGQQSTDSGSEQNQEQANSPPQQQQQRQQNGSRRKRNRGRGKGKNRTLRRQGTQGTRLIYR